MENEKRKEMWRVIKFVLFSISAGVIEIGSYTLLHEFTNIDSLSNFETLFGNGYGLTYFIALVLSVIWNFTFNRKFTFKSVANVPVAMLKVFGYYCVFAPVSIWWTVQLTNRQWNEYLVLLGTMFVNLITEFLFDRYVVFRSTIDTNDLAKREQEREVDR